MTVNAAGTYSYHLVLKGYCRRHVGHTRVRHSCDAEKFTLSSDGGDCGSKKWKRVYGEAWRSLSLVGIWSLLSIGRFCVGGFGRIVA
jgi:hypothetical protein